jgi:hypothetical protein
MSNFHHMPLIYLNNSPLEFPQEGSSSFSHFLKYLVTLLSFEANKIILKNLMADLCGGTCGGNKPPPSPPLKPWVASIYGPLNLPPNAHDLHENYLKHFPKYDG